MQQQLTEARSEITRLQSDLLYVEGVSAQWADIAQNREDLVEALQAERDAAIQQMEGAQAQIAQLQEQLAQAQSQSLAARLQERETRNHQLTVLVADLRQQLAQLQQDKADSERGFRAQAETLRHERDELLSQLGAGAPGSSLDLEAMQAIRDRILSQTRSDKLKAVKMALDQFLSSIQGLAL